MASKKVHLWAVTAKKCNQKAQNEGISLIRIVTGSKQCLTNETSVQRSYSGICMRKRTILFPTLAVSHSELDFCIWNANSQSFGRTKSEAKMSAHGGKFCTSVSVPFAVLYVSFSPLQVYTTLILSFYLLRLRKRCQPWKMCSDEILLDQFYIIKYLKGFIIAVWPKKNCLKMAN